jgi:hypothetical protein
MISQKNTGFLPVTGILYLPAQENSLGICSTLSVLVTKMSKTEMSHRILAQCSFGIHLL